jgi:phage recombination protein Bet
MNAVVKAEEAPQLPAPVARRGITEAQWRTMVNLFPGARSESVMLVWDYCIARKLDPLKKPCHIVPMYANGSSRDVVMPGIYEYRTTAARTGEYMGHSRPEYGPVVDYKGVPAPEFCSLTVYRWNKASGQRSEYPVTIWFSECVALRWDKDAKEHKVNERWTKAPRQMLTKCAEAAALREAFPDEFGGEHTAEEMEGQFSQTEEPVITGRVNPRGDQSDLDWEERDKHVKAIKELIEEFGSDEGVIGAKLREYVEAYQLQTKNVLFPAVFDKCASDGIITKTYFRKLLEVPQGPRERT